MYPVLQVNLSLTPATILNRHQQLYLLLVILKCHSCKAQALITSSCLDLGNSPLPDLSSSFHPAQHVKMNPPRAKISSLHFLHRSLITAYNTKSSQTRSLAFPTLLCSLTADFCNHLPSPQRTPAAPIGLLLLYCTPLGMWEVLTPRERDRQGGRNFFAIYP